MRRKVSDILLVSLLGAMLLFSCRLAPARQSPTKKPPTEKPPTPIVIPPITPAVTGVVTGVPSERDTITVISDSAVIPGACDSLQALELTNTTLEAAEVILPGWSSPMLDFQSAGEQVVVDTTFCRVAGVITPAIHFEVWMPLTSGQNTWNGRFVGIGNGGLAGTIRYPDLNEYMMKGFATASTDTGHQGDSWDGTWMLHNPDIWADFAYRSIHMTTLAAKAVLQAFYGDAPRYSYFVGCSDGGYQALMEAQRYPTDYDGIVAGNPGNYPTRSCAGEVYRSYLTNRSPENVIPKEKLPAIQQAALNACDADDGLADSVIGDPLRCDFDPATMLCRGADSPDCLTAGEVDTLQKVYAGLYDPTTGVQFWPGLEPGGELFWTLKSGFLSGNVFGPALAYFQYILFENTPNWDWRTFDFTNPKDFAIITEGERLYGPVLDANSPDLSAFRASGGKLLLYHGWSDQMNSPRHTINYYESVEAFMGGAANTQDFFRLFMVPGMIHCGPGTDGLRIVNMLQAVTKWVEQGRAPDTMVSSGDNGMKRLLCPYPQVAIYKGSGDTNRLESYRCVNP
jgi:feruloyl esterase